MSTLIFYIKFTLFIDVFLSFSLQPHSEAEMWCHAGRRDYQSTTSAVMTALTLPMILLCTSVCSDPALTSLLATWGVITAAVCRPGPIILQGQIPPAAPEHPASRWAASRQMLDLTAGCRRAFDQHRHEHLDPAGLKHCRLPVELTEQWLWLEVWEDQRGHHSDYKQIHGPPEKKPEGEMIFKNI